MGVANKRTKKSDLKTEQRTPEEKGVTPPDDLGYIPLSRVESGLYWSSWVAITGYILYLVYKTSNGKCRNKLLKILWVNANITSNVITWLRGGG